MKTILTILLLLFFFNCSAQLEKPAVLLSHVEMTASGGSDASEFRLFGTNLASLEKLGVVFPTTGSYRVDLSGYIYSGSPQVQVLIDGVIQSGTMTFTSTALSVKSLFISSISAGAHTVKIQLSNWNSDANNLYVGLLYFTQTSNTTPPVFPTITPGALSTSYLTAEDFGKKRLRGFNASVVNTLADLASKDLPGLRGTGANIARYWLTLSHAPGSSVYYYSDGSGVDLGTTPLTTLDSAVKIAAAQGLYLILTTQIRPTQGACDLWGDSAGAVNRRAGVIDIWKQLALRYKNKVSIGGYDFINEPRNTFNYAQYLRWASDMRDSIRTVDVNHVVVVECLNSKMFGMMIPLPYDNVVYSPHGYSTLLITHQGLSNTVINNYPHTVSTSNLAAPWGITQLSLQHDDVRTLSQRFHVPVFIGEFSTVNYAPASSTAGKWTSTEWCNDNITLIEAEGWSWNYHAWKEYQAWDADRPSSAYAGYTFVNAFPTIDATHPWPARSTLAPTLVMLEGWFGLNNVTCPTSGTTTTSKYHFSTACGDDSRTPTQARNPATPWKTLAKATQYFPSLLSGDTLAFNKDETFQGALTVGKSGITITSYGSGTANPVFTSMIDIGGWVNTGNNIWISEVNASLGSSVTVVTRDGRLLQLGRLPNADAANGGYLTFELHNGTTSITDAQLASSPNWTGAEMVVRTKHFTTELRTVISQAAGTLTPNTAFQQTPEDNGGYFFQKDLRTLDAEGEWYYNPSTKRLYIKSATAPTNIQASTGTDLITSTSFSTIKIRNITFKGVNNYAIAVTNGTGFDVQNCSFQYAQRAISGESSSSMNIRFNTMTNMLADGIIFHGGSNNTASDNNLDSTYQWPGMGYTQYDIGAYGIRSQGAGTTIERNRITNTGYCGIRMNSTNGLVKNNFINVFNNKQNDGGGIYSGAFLPANTGQVFSDNIILNGVGAPLGASTSQRYTAGIYLDNNNSDNTVLRNTISNTYWGLYCHRGHNNNMYANTMYDCSSTQLFINEDHTTDLVTGDSFKQNIVFGRTAGQRLSFLLTVNGTLRNFGTFDSNYYCRPISEPDGINNSGSSTGAIIQAQVGTTSYWSLDQWKISYSPYESKSKKSPKLITSDPELRFEYNASMSDTLIGLGSYSWLDGKGTLYQNTLTLKPFQSAVLIRGTLVGLQPPVVSINVTGSFITPGNVTLTATATDADGTITDVKFYNGATLLNTDVSNPYSYNWTGLAAGTYTVTAKATDNSGLITTSSPVTFTISNPLPVVNITSPPTGQTYTAPAAVVIAANASILTGTITKVNFYSNNIFIGTDASSPYSFTWGSVPIGTYSLTAVAVSSYGDSTRSAAVSISVSGANLPPTVSLTSPLAGSSTNTNYTLTATASDDGTIASVSFYDNGVLLITDNTSPYTTNQTFSVGSHSLTAVATDNLGATGTSAPVVVTVLSPNIFPTVSITSPLNNAGFASPATFSVDVTASDADGTIVAVHYYRDGVIQGSDASSPYSFTETGLGSGGYVLRAVAVDNSGDSTTSSAISITVTTVTQPPDTTQPLSGNVQITSPILCAGGTAVVTVSATGGVEPYTGTGDFVESAGVYNFFIADSGSVNKDTVTISINEPGALSATATLSAIQKYKGFATVVINAIGGTSPFQYSRDGGITWQTSNTFKLKAGVYTVTVRDANGCLTTVTFSLTQPKPGSNFIIHTDTTYINL